MICVFTYYELKKINMYRDFNVSYYSIYISKHIYNINNISITFTCMYVHGSH